MDPTKYVVFVPTKDRSFRKKDVVQLHKVILFPGYVFVASTDDPETCYKKLEPMVMWDEAAFKLLGEETLKCAVVSEQDKNLLAYLMNKEFHIPAVEAIKVGDIVEISNGILEGFEGRAVKINKYRKTVDIELSSDFMGEMRTMTFALKLVERK
ncbi:hypothetical protein FACS189490_03240 [Clostridia bacterium]|nr:hypothetical protein FACS189490_03240 [Clostridia bacterium]